MSKIKITAVSYLNTLPFLYGIEHSGYVNGLVSVDLQPPALCASSLLSGDCDVALVPVAALNRLDSFFLCSDYCIGAEGAVQTVVLASNVPQSEIKKIYLDYQSRTSVVLVQVLAKMWWGLGVEWVQAKPDYLDNLEDNAGYVIIGDRVFSNIHRFSFVWDLAHEWKEYKGMPFVFAAWASLKPIDPEFEVALNKALAYGVEHIPQLVDEIQDKYRSAHVDLYDYYTNKISYHFDNDKRKALSEFLALSLTV